MIFICILLCIKWTVTHLCNVSLIRTFQLSDHPPVPTRLDKWLSTVPTVPLQLCEEKGHLLPTLVQKITCRRFDWMLQSSSLLPWWRLEHSVETSASYSLGSSWYQITFSSFTQKPTEKPLKENSPVVFFDSSWIADIHMQHLLAVNLSE